MVLHPPQSARGPMRPSRCVNAPRMKQMTKMLRRRFWRARERGEEMGKRRKRPKKRARKPGSYQKPHIPANCNPSHRKTSADKAKEEADALEGSCESASVSPHPSILNAHLPLHTGKPNGSLRIVAMKLPHRPAPALLRYLGQPLPPSAAVARICPKIVRVAPAATKIRM